jgi:hypothetical protein
MQCISFYTLRNRSLRKSWSSPDAQESTAQEGWSPTQCSPLCTPHSAPAWSSRHLPQRWGPGAALTLRWGCKALLQPKEPGSKSGSTDLAVKAVDPDSLVKRWQCRTPLGASKEPPSSLSHGSSQGREAWDETRASIPTTEPLSDQGMFAWDWTGTNLSGLGHDPPHLLHPFVDRELG